MKLEIVLIVASAQPSWKFLCISRGGLWSWPTCYLKDDQTALQCAAGMFRYYTGIAPRVDGVGWVDLEAKPIFDSPKRLSGGERVISMPFFGVIPEEIIRLPEGVSAHWVPLNTLFQQEMFMDHKEILQGSLAQ